MLSKVSMNQPLKTTQDQNSPSYRSVPCFVYVDTKIRTLQFFEKKVTCYDAEAAAAARTKKARLTKVICFSVLTRGHTDWKTSDLRPAALRVFMSQNQTENPQVDLGGTTPNLSEEGVRLQCEDPRSSKWRCGRRTGHSLVHWTRREPEKPSGVSSLQ